MATLVGHLCIVYVAKCYCSLWITAIGPELEGLDSQREPKPLVIERKPYNANFSLSSSYVLRYARGIHNSSRGRNEIASKEIIIQKLFILNHPAPALLRWASPAKAAAVS